MFFSLISLPFHGFLGDSIGDQFGEGEKSKKIHKLKCLTVTKHQKSFQRAERMLCE